MFYLSLFIENHESLNYPIKDRQIFKFLFEYKKFYN